MKKVLFICKHNASRSVIAESLATYIWSDEFKIASGGSDPIGSIDPVVKRYLEDNDLPIPHNHSHSWEERTSFRPDIVIILCDTLHNEAAPVWLSGGLRINWQVDAFPEDCSEEEKYQHCALIYDSLERRLSIAEDVICENQDRNIIEAKLRDLKPM